MRKNIAGLLTLAILSAAQPAAADTVSDWVEFTSRIHSPLDPAPEGRARPETSRAITRVSLAMFEALNAIDHRYESYVGLAQGDKNASLGAAAITAAYHVLSEHFPSAKNQLDDGYAIAPMPVQWRKS